MLKLLTTLVLLQVIPAFANTAEKARTTKSGAVFTRVSPEELKALGVTDPDAFAAANEAWSEPDVVLPDGSKGKVWGNSAMKKGGVLPRFMNWEKANDHCEALGAKLPSGWPKMYNHYFGQESDFARLAKYMLAKSGMSLRFFAQILPNLTYEKRPGTTRGRRFWSSTPCPHDETRAYEFGGEYGDIFEGIREYGDEYQGDGVSVMCVAKKR